MPVDVSTTTRVTLSEKLQLDRLNGATSQTYDKNGNVLSIADAENRTTGYEYNERNKKVKETYPDHTGGNPGDASYGIIELAYDPAGPLQFKGLVHFSAGLGFVVKNRQQPKNVPDPLGTRSKRWCMIWHLGS